MACGRRRMPEHDVTCQWPDCDRTDILARGLCGRCVKRAQRAGRIQEFQAHQRTCGGCGDLFAPGSRMGNSFCSAICRSLAAARARRSERAQKLGGRSCSRCGVGLHISARVDARYCSTTCQQADWYDTNGDRLRAAARDWSRRNPDLRLDAHRRRRARKQGAEVGPIDLEVVWLRDEGKCWICGRVVDGKATNPAPLSGSLDHVIPLAAGGAHNMSNVALAHLRCNIQKKDRLLDRIPSWMHRGGDAT